MYLPSPRPNKASTSVVLFLILLTFGAILYFLALSPREPAPIQDQVAASPPLSYIQKCITMDGVTPGLAPDDPRAIEQDERYKECIAAYRP